MKGWDRRYSSNPKRKAMTFWMARDLWDQVREKAERDDVNLSALLRGFLRDWLKGCWTPLCTDEDSERKIDG
jgi:hypothetical protein